MSGIHYVTDISKPCRAIFLFRALSGRLKFTVRRHTFNKYSLFGTGARARGVSRRGAHLAVQAGDPGIIIIMIPYQILL